MISTTAACGYIPRAPYIGGPLDGSSAAPLRRKAETVHPQYRTHEGRSVRGGERPNEHHYVHVTDGTWGGSYWYVAEVAAQ